MTEEAKPPFSVDTHLFRELGELLVGRESTALIELIKNAYDADATEVTVLGENLDDPTRGIIQISDDGNGMTPDAFRRGFLRVAGRLKTSGAGISERYQRRYTGSKGVGRLAAHKLARIIEIQSTPRSTNGESVLGVNGFINWNEVEAVETLDQVTDRAVSTNEISLPNDAPHGTTLRLKSLRQKWTPSQRGRFLAEIAGLQAPSLLVAPLDPAVVPSPGLFDSPMVADSPTGDPGFALKLEGGFEVGDNYWPAILGAANWVLEIDARADVVRYAVMPTQRTLKEVPGAGSFQFSEMYPEPTGPYFHARLLLREGSASGKRDERAWSNRLAGVRVYMERFRVLPYGEDSDDWLYLSRDYSSRDRKLRFLANSEAPGDLEEVGDEGLLHLTNKHFFGGVFLTANRAGSLQMLINREGFIPDASYDTLTVLVRRGIDLLTRVRAASRASGVRNDAETGKPRRGRSTKETAQDSVTTLAQQVEVLKEVAAHSPDQVRVKLTEVIVEIDRARAVSRKTIPANTMVLVLAAVGTQLAAFTHEVNRLLGLANDLESLVSQFENYELVPRARKHASRVLVAATELRRAIERQAAYLVDVVTPDARRRRSRLNVRELLDATWKLIATSAGHYGINFRNDVPAELQTPLMFRAELVAVLTNLLTNAVKAAGKDGWVRATAHLADNAALRIRLENTGVAVDPADGERWFGAFESTTVQADPILGQGMGLGLGIARDILAEVGAVISFVRPRKGASTAIEIAFPGA